MCDTNAYIYKDGNEELYLENVDEVRLEEDKVFLKSLFGEQKVFEGDVRLISLRDHKIVLKERDK
ncbi:MAG: CooT family nickel-binding protein [Nitrospirota bacterium]|nr:MAG: CooT family nickel-binding protein [Nitrospirota bacterium]